MHFVAVLQTLQSAVSDWKKTGMAHFIRSAIAMSDSILKTGVLRKCCYTQTGPLLLDMVDEGHVIDVCF